MYMFYHNITKNLQIIQHGKKFVILNSFMDRETYLNSLLQRCTCKDKLPWQRNSFLNREPLLSLCIVCMYSGRSSALYKSRPGYYVKYILCVCPAPMQVTGRFFVIHAHLWPAYGIRGAGVTLLSEGQRHDCCIVIVLLLRQERSK